MNIEKVNQIRFIRPIVEPACGDHPTLLYADKDELGWLGKDTDGSNLWACVDGINNWFTVNSGEFEII